MKKLDPDIIADVRLIKSEDGGRLSATPNDFFTCSAIIDEKKYDCRIILDSTGSLHPGEEKKLGIKFLNPSFVSSKISAGFTFEIWDGKIIGNCTILKILKL